MQHPQDLPPAIAEAKGDEAVIGYEIRGSPSARGIEPHLGGLMLWT